MSVEPGLHLSPEQFVEAAAWLGGIGAVALVVALAVVYWLLRGFITTRLAQFTAQTHQVIADLEKDLPERFVPRREIERHQKHIESSLDDIKAALNLRERDEGEAQEPKP